MTAADLAFLAGVSTGVIKGLIDAGALQVIERPADPPFGTPAQATGSDVLNPSQHAAANRLIALIGAGGFKPALLDGVTGSGKTEVYLEAASKLLSDDPDAQVLILLPEIALTQALLSRVSQRFGVTPGEWHSGVAHGHRRQLWDGVAKGDCRIVVGARSALFLPYRRLRLIVVDEEHDGSYKQEEGFIYQARDMAVARA
eukprot:gene15742-18535_t